MISLDEFSKIVNSECLKTISEFMSNEENIKSSRINESRDLESICGPSVEVVGKKLKYSCILEYENVDNIKFLDLLIEKYPFVDNSDIPELDIMDLFGEFLNILCGKINLSLESTDSELNIEIPYFTYGIQDLEISKIVTQKYEFNELSFKLHFYLN
jgi:hypothetical protein